MEVKDGYKQTEEGVIPIDWNIVKLGSIIRNIYRGASPRPIDDQKWFDNKSSIGWVRITDVTQSGRYLLDTTQRLSKEGVRNSRFIPKGALIMSICATVGRPIETKIDTCIHDGFVVFDRPSINQSYLYHVLKDIEPRWSSKGQTGSQMNLNTNLIQNTNIPLPPTLAEQEAIAGALSDADALIESLEQLIAKKRLVKQGAMQELLTGKRRLPGFSGEWEMKRLGDVCEIYGRIGFRGYTINDIVAKGDGAIAISPSNIRGNTTDFTDSTYISWPKYEESPEIKIYNGDIILVKTGSTFGKTAIVQNLTEKATLNPQLVVLKKVTIDNIFLGYMMAFRTIQDQITAHVVGGALPTLSQQLVARFNIPIPSTRDEQIAIASILSDMDAEIAALEEKLAKARLVKQGMMQELLTGRIRLV